MIWLPGILSQGGKKYVWERYTLVKKEVVSGNTTKTFSSSKNVSYWYDYTIQGNYFVPDGTDIMPVRLLSGREFFYETEENLTEFYECVSVSTSGSTSTVTVKIHSLKNGAGLLLNTVTSGSPTAYPDNGEQDGYWYVRVEAGADPAPGINYVGYIQSSGTQFIDSNFKPNQNTRVVMDVELTTSTSSSNQWLFCGRTALQKAAFGFFHNKQNFGATYGTIQDTAILSSDGLDRITIDFNKNVLTFTGGSKTFSSQTFTSAGTLCLLTRNSNGTKDCYASAKLYSCKIYDNGVLIRDYRPCLDPDGVACMYDEVNTEYVYNAGSGTFAYGMAA